MRNFGQCRQLCKRLRYLSKDQLRLRAADSAEPARARIPTRRPRSAATPATASARAALTLTATTIAIAATALALAAAALAVTVSAAT